MKLWLSRLEEVANKGNILALQAVYYITGEILSSGLNIAVGTQMADFHLEAQMFGLNSKNSCEKICRT